MANNRCPQCGWPRGCHGPGGADDDGCTPCLRAENARLLELARAGARREAELLNALLSMQSLPAGTLDGRTWCQVEARDAVRKHQAQLNLDIATHGDLCDLLNGHQQVASPPSETQRLASLAALARAQGDGANAAVLDAAARDAAQEKAPPATSADCACGAPAVAHLAMCEGCLDRHCAENAPPEASPAKVDPIAARFARGALASNLSGHLYDCAAWQRGKAVGSKSVRLEPSKCDCADAMAWAKRAASDKAAFRQQPATETSKP